jgi:iron complex outermembrane receptor protein
MKKIAFGITLLSAFSVFAEEDNKPVEELEDLSVEGQIYAPTTVKLLPESSSVLQDTADVLKKMPGAYVNKNGALSGIAQYRGLFGARVNVKADGVQVVESCSNSMDAAMSHVPASMVDAVVLQRGISAVSEGIETLGGSIDVVVKTADSVSDGFSGDVNLAFATANNGKTASLNLNSKRDFHALVLGLDTEKGDNQSIPTGENVFTGLERDYYSLAYQYDDGNNKFSLTTNYNHTGETGTPSLPMDITYAKGGISQMEYSTEIGDKWAFEGLLAHQNTKHLMDNFRHRNQQPAKFRESLTRVKRDALSLKLLRISENAGFSIGMDYDDMSNTAFITNPNNAQFNITNFDASKQRLSLFAEYQRKLSDVHQFNVGIRWTESDADSAEVNSSVANMNNSMGQLHRTLRDRFNAADRNRTDQNLDLMFNWQHAIHNQFSFEYGFGIKNRAPTHQERYLWLPLEATAGLADGRQYLGNLLLKSEQAYQWEFGINYDNGSFSASPHLFYHRVDDYIQGVPNTVMPAPANVLRFDNVDAELYGFDIEWSYQFNEQFSLRNVTSYVRGKRRDINDNLYRIAPVNTWLNLSYELNQWQLEADVLAALAQDDVSETNSEKATPGFGVLNLSVIRSFNNNSYIKLAVNNVFDKLYYQHTNGYNRNNTNVDVGFDANNLQAYRLPAEGRSFQISYFVGW